MTLSEEQQKQIGCAAKIITRSLALLGCLTFIVLIVATAVAIGVKWYQLIQ